MPMTHTHTYVTLEISEAAYEEIRAKLFAAESDIGFLSRTRRGDKGTGPIDMSGIAVIPAGPPPPTNGPGPAEPPRPPRDRGVR